MQEGAVRMDESLEIMDESHRTTEEFAALIGCSERSNLHSKVGRF